MMRPLLTNRVETVEARTQVLDRVQRWAATTDSRIVQGLWPTQADGAQHALCPSCGGTMRDGMLITLNQMAACFRVGPAQQALATGDVDALTSEMPIEPGELWCIVCLPCLEGQGRLLDGRGLTKRLHALVDKALQDD